MQFNLTFIWESTFSHCLPPWGRVYCPDLKSVIVSWCSSTGGDKCHFSAKVQPNPMSRHISSLNQKDVRHVGEELQVMVAKWLIHAHSKNRRNGVLDKDVIAIRVQPIDSHAVPLMGWMHQSLMSWLAAYEKENCPLINATSPPVVQWSGRWKCHPLSSQWAAVMKRKEEELMFKRSISTPRAFEFNPSGLWIPRISVRRPCFCWSSVIREKKTDPLPFQNPNQRLFSSKYTEATALTAAHISSVQPDIRPYLSLCCCWEQLWSKLN